MSIVINIEKWDNCKKSVFVTTWDDFCIDSWKKLTDYANKNNIPLTFFINTCGYCEAGKFQKDNNYITQETKMSKENIIFLKQLVKKGNEISYHTTEHTDMRNMSIQEMEKDFKKWISIMEKNNLIDKKKGITLAYPYGYIPKNIELIKKYFLGARSTNYGLNEINPTNIYKMKSINIGKMTTIEKLTLAVDKAIEEEKIIIESGHGINQECWSPIKQEIIFKHFDYVSKKQQLWCTTFINLIKYIIQRQNIEIILKKMNYEEIKFNIKNKIKFNFETIPLTVSFQINGNKKIKGCYQNKKELKLNKINNLYFIKTKDFNNIITVRYNNI